MNELVFMHGLNEEPYTTDEIIAKNSNNQLRVVKNLIRIYKNELSKFGVLHFESVKPPKGSKGGRPIKTYHLNQQQATLLITFLDNTPKVVQFKVALVREFHRMKQELTTRQINRAVGKPQRRTLTDAIKDWSYGNRFDYRNMTELLVKRATGMTVSQIRKQRHVKNAQDALTSTEQERYKNLENMMISLLSMDKTRDEIKGTLLLV